MLSVSGFYRKEETLKKKKNTNLNWHHWTDFFVFVLTCQNLGLLGLVKKKEKTMDLKKTLGLDDQWTDWTHRRETADAQCFGMYVACACSDSVDLLQGLVLLLRGSGGIEKNGSSSD